MGFLRNTGIAAGCLLAGLVFQASFAVAAPQRGVGRLADVRILDRTTNETLPVHWFRGRPYVVGKPGNEYQIEISNRSRNSILAIVSVDGVDVQTGDAASFNTGGFIYDVGRSYPIKGWQKSWNRTAAFYFTSISDSYAGRTGRPDNVGVIGVALFKEKQPEPPAPNYNGNKTKDLPMRRAAPPAESSPLGTGHGRIESSDMREAEFERASSSPAEIIQIYYDSYDNLVARGVIKPQTRIQPVPQAFPGQTRFVPDPPK